MDAILTKPYNHNLGGNTALYESTGGKRKRQTKQRKSKRTRKSTKRRR